MFVIHFLKASKNHFSWKKIIPQQENKFSVIKILIVSFYITKDRIFTGGTLNVETISYYNKLDPNEFPYDPQMASLQHFLFKNNVKISIFVKSKAVYLL